MPWKITYDGHEWHEADLTLGEAERICEITKTNWGRIRPFESPTHFMAIFAMFQARSGIPVDETMAKLRDVSALEMIKTISYEDPNLPTEYTDGFPPKADSPSTS